MHTPFIKTLPWLYTPPHIIIHKCIVQGMARSTQDKLMCTGKHRPYIKTLGMAGWHIYIYIHMYSYGTEISGKGRASNGDSYATIMYIAAHDCYI